MGVNGGPVQLTSHGSGADPEWRENEQHKEANDDDDSCAPIRQDEINYDRIPGIDRTNNKTRWKQSEQSEAVTDETAGMTVSMTDESGDSFTFEIDLPAPADVSPLSCKESVVGAMMARSVDRALENGPSRPPFEENRGVDSPRGNQKRRSHHHRRHRHQRDDSSGDHRGKRSRSSHIRGSSHHSSSQSSSSNNLDATRRRHRSASEKPSSQRSRLRDGVAERGMSTTSVSRDVSSEARPHRRRSKSRTDSNRESTVVSRSSLNIAPIKEELEESHSQIAEAPQGELSSRNRSMSRPRSPSQKCGRSEGRVRPPTSERRSRSGSKHRSASRNSVRSKSRVRSPSSKRRGESRPSSPSHTRSPSSKGRGESRPSSPSHERSPSSKRRSESRPSHTRSPSRTRSASRPRSQSRSRNESSKSSPRSQSSSKRSSLSKDIQKRGGEVASTNGSSQQNRDRSKSRPRERSKSRSRQKPGQSAEEYLEETMKSEKLEDGLFSLEEVIKPVSLGPSSLSFLSRLEESKEKSAQSTPRATNSHETDEQQKSIRWGGTEPEKMSSSHQRDHGRKTMLDVVIEEGGEVKEVNKPEAVSDQEEVESKRRSVSRSLSNRRRSQSRSERTVKVSKEQERKERKSKWDDLLMNASNLSSFSFDDTEYKSVLPRITPVVLKSRAVSVNPSKITARMLSDTGLLSPQPSDVEKIISDTKKKAADSRLRQARLSARHIGHEEATPVRGNTSKTVAMDRLREANALILAKRQRREDSKARQKRLGNIKPIASTSSTIDMDLIPSPIKRFVEAGNANAEAQFVPSLIESKTPVSAGSSFIDTGKSGTKMLGEKTAKDAILEPDTSSRWSGLKKGMEMISRSKRNLMENTNAISDEASPAVVHESQNKDIGWSGLKKGMEMISRSKRNLMENTFPLTDGVRPAEVPESRDKDIEPQHQNTLKRRERKTDRESHRKSRSSDKTTETPSASSKWKDLTTRAQALKKPASSKWSNLKTSLDAAKTRSRSRNESRHRRIGDQATLNSPIETNSRKLIVPLDKDDKQDCSDVKATVTFTTRGRSKWTGLKGGIQFIARIKDKGAEAKKTAGVEIIY